MPEKVGSVGTEGLGFQADLRAMFDDSPPTSDVPFPHISTEPSDIQGSA
jgi:hypothetical protein